MIHFRLRCAQKNTIRAPKASAQKATPNPIPAFAPIERPEDGCGILGAGGVPIVELVAEVEVVDKKVVWGAMLYPFIWTPHAWVSVVYEVLVVNHDKFWSRVA